jgi:5-methylcytosine-specific restriction endonuclease McrA
MKNKHLYPVDWIDTIRPAILKRDNYKCQICGIKHRSEGYYNQAKVFIVCDEWLKQWAQSQKIKVLKLHLQIAHKNHIKDDCRPENLEALCPRCHLNSDREFNNILRKLAGRQKKKSF